MSILEWITSNAGSLIAGAIVILLLIVLLRSTIRAKRNGDCSCVQQQSSGREEYNAVHGNGA